MHYCDKFKESFSSYVEGELAPDTRQVLESHLSICPECRETVQRLNILRKTLKQLSRITTSPDFDYQLNQRLRQTENRRLVKFPLNYFQNWKIPAFSFAFILIAFSFFMFYGTEPADVSIDKPEQSIVNPSIPTPKEPAPANEENIESAQGGDVSAPSDSAKEEYKKKVNDNMHLVNKKSSDN